LTILPTSIDSKTLAAMLSVLAEPNRLLILDLLMSGVQCNCELGGKLKMAPNLVSHHLNVLRHAGLINVERDTSDARWLYYSINQEKIDELVAAMIGFMDRRHAQMDTEICCELTAPDRGQELTVVSANVSCRDTGER